MFFRWSTLGKAVVSFKPLTSSKELPSMLFDGQEKHWEPQVLSSEPFLFRPPPRHSASLNRVTQKNQLTSTLVIYIPFITLHRVKSGTCWYFDDILVNDHYWPASRKVVLHSGICHFVCFNSLLLLPIYINKQKYPDVVFWVLT